ncbi:anti-sigma factor [Streptodolium elevatio]|uniref:Anti-sigma factor n=1 Tax=Streptodolium elevatio TaxID=3157996 RepID=A0ABV3DIP5_9ACTN
MNHSDPGTLALAALGEQVPETDRAHIAACPVCGAELDQLRAVVRAGRQIRPEDEPSPPPARLWRRIADELDFDGDLSVPGPSESDPSMLDPSALDPSAPDPSVPAEEAPADRGAGPAEGPEGAVRTGGPWFRLRKSLALAASAAVIGAAAGVGGTLWATDEDESPRARVDAETRLDPLPTHQAAGAAFVDTTTGGEAGRRLVVRVSGLTPQPGFYEVWLLDRDAKNMIAVGILPVGGEATFDLPANLDLDGYPVVDVSVQQYNGSPEHSGNSVVRGTLPS